MSNIIACYPGTFDPITLGHLDVIKRATRLFSKLIIAVAESTKKNTWFTTKERLSLIKESVKEVNLDLDKVEIVSFNSLLVDFCKKKLDGKLRYSLGTFGGKGKIIACVDVEYDVPSYKPANQCFDNTPRAC
ncbi:MAG TPA: hypothetical protein EYP08_01745 [Pyrodictiaceae archaeon]|nr:hypothetical protein [Pyrodictiaceae archaeon]